MALKLIIGSGNPHHVSDDVVAEFEKAIESDHRIERIPAAGRNVSRSAYLLWKGLKPLGSRFFTRSLFRDDYFAVMMGLNRFKCSPFFLGSGKKAVYLFDAWPRDHARIREFVASFQVDYVFLTSSQAAQRLSNSVPGCEFSWIPEAVDPSEYASRSYDEKDIEVLQIGRKYDLHHDRICHALQKAGKSYLYEEVKGRVIFPSRKEFIHGLARSRISICVPSSMTHPDRSGDLETVTARYFQSMVSRCLILGHAPQEMISLFGYNPVIEIDADDPAGQVLSLLENFMQYIPFLERNYAEVLRHHTWQHRWRQIAERIFAELP